MSLKELAVYTLSKQADMSELTAPLAIAGAVGYPLMLGAQRWFIKSPLKYALPAAAAVGAASGALQANYGGGPLFHL